jgi:hypothetical protein
MQQNRLNRAKMLEDLIERLRAFIERYESRDATHRSSGDMNELHAILVELEHLRTLMPKV